MKQTLYIILICLLLLGCKKEHRYLDDPKVTRDTPQERLNGIWKITSYTFNGNDIYTKLNQKATTQYNLDNVLLNYVYHTRKEAGENNVPGNALNIMPVLSTQYWNFDDDTYLKINSQGCNTIGDSLANYWFVSPQNFCATSSAYWEITKLYEKDFHIVLKTDSGTYKITFIKTKI